MAPMVMDAAPEQPDNTRRPRRGTTLPVTAGEAAYAAHLMTCRTCLVRGGCRDLARWAVVAGLEATPMTVAVAFVVHVLCCPLTDTEHLCAAHEWFADRVRARFRPTPTQAQYRAALARAEQLLRAGMRLVDAA